jgi:hypothetical protein
MKQTLIVILAALALTACSSTSLTKKTDPVQLGRKMQPVADPDKVKSVGDTPADRRAEAVAKSIPDWYLKAPVQEGYIFGTGTAVSRDLEMSKEKALTMAQGKIAEAVAGRVTKNTRIFRADTGSTVVENSKSTIKKTTSNVDFSGTEIVEVVVRLAPNGHFRTYVLTALPLGDNNLIRKQRLEEDLTRSLIANDKDDEVDSAPAVTEPVSFNIVDKNDKVAVLNLPHQTISDQTIKNRINDLIENNPDTVIIQGTVR